MNKQKKIFNLNQVTFIGCYGSLRRNDLYKWVKKERKHFWCFWKEPEVFYVWKDDDYSLVHTTDEELLSYFKDICDRTDLYIKDKILYQKPYVRIKLSDGNEIIKDFEHDTFAESYYLTLTNELSYYNIPIKSC